MAKSPVSPKRIKQLRDEFAKIDRINVDSPAYLARNRLKKPIEKASADDANAIPTHEEVINEAKKKYDLAVKQWQVAKEQGKPVDELVKLMTDAKKEYDDAMKNAGKPITTVETSALKRMKGLLSPRSASNSLPRVAPTAVLLAHTVEKHRNGHPVTTFELASLVKRLAHSDLSSDEIADRLTKAYGDVLLTPED